MKIRKVAVGFIVLSFVAYSLPAMAETPAGAVAPSQFKASVDNAIASVASGDRSPNPTPALHGRLLTKEFSTESAEPAPATGGGGSHIGLIVTLVTTAAGLAASYYMIKQLRKTMTPVGVPTAP